jgi:hypothetical protein
MKKILISIYVVGCLMCLVSLGWKMGTSYQKDKDLWQCKKAGWDFIEEVVLDREFAHTHPRGKKYGMGLLMDLQSNIATKCIVRIK